MGFALKAHAICLLHDRAMTPAELAEELGISHQVHVSRFVNALYRDKRVHVESWKLGDNALPIARFRLGTRPDVATPEGRDKGIAHYWKRQAGHRRHVSVETQAFLAALCAFDDGATRKEAVQEAGTRDTPVFKLIRVLREHKLLRVCRWVKEGGAHFPIAVFKFGSAPDAQRPAPMTKKETNANYWRRRNHLATLRTLSAAFSSNAGSYLQSA